MRRLHGTVRRAGQVPVADRHAAGELTGQLETSYADRLGIAEDAIKAVGLAHSLLADGEQEAIDAEVRARAFAPEEKRP
jgi:hypothetical protein